MRPVMNLDDALQDLAAALGCRLVVQDDRIRVLGYSIHESEADHGRLSYLLAHSDTWPALPAGLALDAGAAPGPHRVGHLVIHLAPGEVPAAIGAATGARLGPPCRRRADPGGLSRRRR